MKKNLLSILILALVLTNLALTIVLMFSILPVYQKTNNVITKIASILDIDLAKGNEDSADANISIDKLATYNIAEGEKMTINLKMEEDGKPHYLIASVTLAMNSESKDYKTYGSDEALKSKENLIKSEINSVVSSYTIDELRVDMEGVQETLVERIQKLYDSDFIVKVAFGDVILQ